MVINVSSRKEEVPYAEEVNAVLHHTFNCMRIAHVMGRDGLRGDVARAPLLEDLLGQTTYMIVGPSKFGGAIKGFALMGYLEYYASLALEKLKAEDGALEKEKRELLHTRRQNEGDWRKVDDMAVALWVAFRDKAIIAPTSGSFGLAAYETIGLLRQIKVDVNGNEFPLFGRNEGRARAWLPSSRLEKKVMTNDKLDFVVAEANRVGATYKIWKFRETRDHFALLDALHGNGDGNGYFCPTNPESVEEFANLLMEVVNNRQADGSPVFEHDETYERRHRELVHNIEQGHPEVIEGLSKLGVEVKRSAGDIELVATKPVVAGRYGLSQARILHLNFLARDGVPFDHTFNQPSIGATLTATAWIDRAVLALTNGEVTLDEQNARDLEQYAPELARRIAQAQGVAYLKLTATPSARNVTLLRDQLGMGGDSPTLDPRKGPENGLGSVRPGYDSPGVLDKCTPKLGGTLQQRYLIATSPWIAVAQALLYVNDLSLYGDAAVVPEEAGAASLAGYLRERYNNGEINIDSIVFALRNNGFGKEAMERLIGEQQEHDRAQGAWSAYGTTFQEDEPGFVAALRAAFDSEIIDLKPAVPTGQNPNGSISFFHTGKNGMEQVTAAVAKKMTKTADVLAAAANGAGSHEPLRGGAATVERVGTTAVATARAAS